MSNWDEEKSSYKAAKLGIIEQRPVGGGNRKKVDKPWKIMRQGWAFGGRPPRPPYVAKRFQTKEEAEAWIEKQARSWYVNRIDQSPRATEIAKSRAIADAKKYWIVGPE